MAPVIFGISGSNHNLLDLVKRNLVAGAVIECGGFRGFVVGDLLGVLDGAAIFEVGGDGGGPEGNRRDYLECTAGNRIPDRSVK